MDSYRHVTVAEATLKEGDLYNLRFDRFMLNPLAFELATEAAGDPVDGLFPLRFTGAAHECAERVDGLVERFVAARYHAERADVAGQLVAMHGQGLLLWPLTLMFGLSTLGKVGKGLFRNTVLAAHPELEAIRTGFEVCGHLGTSAKAVETQRFMWAFVVGLRFASTATIVGPEDFKNRHLQLVSDIVRPDGIRHPRVPSHHDRALWRLVEHYRHHPDTFGNVTVHWRKGARPERPADCPAYMEWLAPAWQEWMAGKDLIDCRHHDRALGLLTDFLATVPPDAGATPAAPCARANMKALLAHASGWSTPDQRRYALSKIRDFAEWLSIEEADASGPSFQVGLFEQDIVRARAKWGAERSAKPGRKMTRPMPRVLHDRCKEIISGDDFAWPKSLTGRLTQWFTWHGPNGELRQEFCPVMSRLLLLLLELPIRGVQARRLDSGEGDDRRWDPEREAWFPNAGRHAGHWRRSGARNIARGVIHEILDKGRTITGLWINSNKTQDRRTLCDETSGYPIPWENPGVLANLDTTRRWNEVFNPVDGPLPHRELSKGLFKDDPTDLVARHIPDRFYLFRTPLNPWQGGHREPPSHGDLTAFFLATLDELERRLAADDPRESVKIILKRRHGVPKLSLFTVHGMRSSTLTGLHQAGVPIGIISKMVAGHASILMTLGYIDYEPQHVSELINAARATSEARDQEQFRAFLKRASFQQAMRGTAGMGDGLPRSPGGGVDLSLSSLLDIGICPNGGTRCREGGGQRNRVDIEVPGGSRNCIRCRFFRTGYPFLFPLWAHGNALLAKADGLARQAKEQEEEMVILKAERAELHSDGRPIPDVLQDRIRSVREAWLTTCEARNGRFDDFHVALELIEKVRALGGWQDADPTDPNLPAKPRAEVPEVKGRQASRYEVVDAVVQASRHYPSLASPDMERERDGMTDRIAYRSGYAPPSLAALGKAEWRRSGDALARLFVSALTSVEVDDLIEGRKRISDLDGLEERFRRICLETMGKEPSRNGPAEPKVAAPLDDEEA